METPPFRRAKRAAWSIAPIVSSEVAAEVTLSTSSCASSTMIELNSGRTLGEPVEKIPTMVWFVTTMSDSNAVCFALSGKQSSIMGQPVPRHSSLDSETCLHAFSLTPGTRSSRSPVSVSCTHSWSRLTCSARLSTPSPSVPVAADTKAASTGRDWSELFGRSNSAFWSSTGYPP